MDREAAEIIAAAMNNMAASTALQAETNVVLAEKLEGLQRTVQGAQAKVDRHMKPLIERSKKQADRMLEEVERRRADATT